MFSILLVVQIVVSISIIALVLMQQGKGADMGAAFGSGSSGTIFGSRGSGSFFTRATGILAAVFFINCLLIASPLVRDATDEGDRLADQLELQQSSEVVDEAVDQLDAAQQQAAEITETLMTGDDVPGGSVAQPGSQVADDLPE